MRFLQAGLVWGGSCFGKDTAALISTAAEYSLDMPIVKAARQVNYSQRVRIIEKLLDELKILKGRTIGLLVPSNHTPMTSAKPQRSKLPASLSNAAPRSKLTILSPCREPAVNAPTPTSSSAMSRSRWQGADALVLVTEWPQYRDRPWGKPHRSHAESVSIGWPPLSRPAEARS